jgi:hypothetical protein
LKNDVNVPSKRNEHKNLREKKISRCFVPVELFSYRERLLQQSGDIGKRDGGCGYDS